MSKEQAELWQRLQRELCVSAEAEPPQPPLQPPWYLSILQGFAGWVAAWFLLGFMASFLALLFDERINQGIVVIGAVFVALGVALDRQQQQQVFVQQLAFVFGVSGLLAVGWGLAEIFDYRNELAWFICFGLVLCLHTLLINNRLSVFLNGLGIAFCISGLLYLWHWLTIMPLIMLLLAILFCLNRVRQGVHYSRCVTLAYAFVSWTLLAQGVLSLGGEDWDLFSETLGSLSIWSWLLPWSLSLLASLVLVRTLLLQQGIALNSPAAFSAIAAVVVIGILAVPLSGLSSAMLFILLGLQLRDKLMTALAIFSIPLFISAYYYSLTVSLLEKSLLLTALGALLLLARWALSRYLPTSSEPHAKEAL